MPPHHMAQIYSQHIFLFPFTYAENFFGEDPHGHCADWRYVDPAWNSSVDRYNQHAYFHNFAENGMLGKVGERPILRQYEYQQLGKCARYQIEGHYKEKDQNIEYKYDLELEKVELTVYRSPKVAILTFHVANRDPKASALSDMVRINARGRRIYPPFLQCKGNPLELVRDDLISDRIRIINQAGNLAEEDFQQFANLKELKERLPLPNHITCFTDKWFGGIRPIVDDRMFVVGWYGDNATSRLLRKKQGAAKEYRYLTDPKWHELVFVDDNGCTTQSDTMLRELLTRHTYDRWVDYGTLFGMTRYSFIMLTQTGGFAENKLLPDLKNLYLPIVRLCLAQRASVLYFSSSVSDALSIEKAADFSQGKAEEIAELFLEYIKFVNRIYFREITTQEQGIDLYDKMQDVMRLRKEVEDLEREMNELNQFADMTQQKDLTQIATAFLPATLIAAILTFISDKYESNNQWFLNTGFWLGFFVMCLLVLLGILSYPLFNTPIRGISKFYNKKKHTHLFSLL